MARKEYGSLQNLLLDRAKCAAPTVGMHATLLRWSDRDPFEVVRVSKKGTVIWVRSLRVTSNNLTTGEQAFEAAPENPEERFQLRNGRWRSHGHTLLLGRAEFYRDPHF